MTRADADVPSLGDSKATLAELRDEVTSLKRKFDEQSRFERWLKILAALGAVVVFVKGAYDYNRSSREATVQRRETAQEEFKKRFWEEQLKVYNDASSAAAAVAMAERIDDTVAVASRAQFWQLYWGKLSILENLEVKDAMVAYGRELGAIEAKRTTHPGNLKQLSYTLARACRHSLKVTWEPVPVDDIPEIK